MLELAAGVLLSAAAVYFVLRPVFRPAPAPAPAPAAEGAGGSEGDDPADDMSARARALRALHEIEFDRATGKLSDGDYDALRAQYTAEAVEALRAAESGTRDAGRGTRQSAAATRPPSPLPRLVCPTHGARPEAEAAFCSRCGRRLVAAA